MEQINKLYKRTHTRKIVRFAMSTAVIIFIIATWNQELGALTWAAIWSFVVVGWIIDSINNSAEEKIKELEEQ